ncbi:hypothetical protein [Peptoniphilus catoniae]|uniref:hypothetical protein n=1 Tax=Peptoniphilus catoniae TaxID=1660341 RepID=UPI0010FEAD1F|nr:hypothetical protein [Peptoniphilus catoniae]
MIKYILGAKGVGKTKWLIDNANEDIKSGNGNIAFVEFDDDHIFSLDYNVRLINADNYRLNDKESFYGFICGLMAMDYDLEKIYIDGIYKIVKLRPEDLEFLKNKLEKVEGASTKEIYVNIDYILSEFPDSLKNNAIEITAE